MNRSARRVGFVVAALLAAAVVAAACGGGEHRGGGSHAPVLSSVTPSHAIVDASVLLTGSNFGATQGASTVDFGGTIATIVSWSDHQIVAKVPATLFPGAAAVTVTVKAQTATQAFDVVLPDVVYVDDNDSSNAVTNAIEAFAISSTGGLTVLPGSPWALGEKARTYGGDAQTIRVDAARRRLYVSGQDFVHPFDIDAHSGALTALPPVFVQGTGSLGLALVPGSELFSAECNYASAGKVSAFLIGSAGGLTPAPGSPHAMATGQSCPIILFAMRGGKYLWALSGNDEMTGWSIQADGSLTPLVTDSFLGLGASSSVYGGVADPAGARMLMPDANGRLFMLDVNAGTGAISVAPGSPLTTPIGPNGVAFSADGAHAFVADAGGNVVYEYDVGGNGALGVLGSGASGTFAYFSSIATDTYGRWVVAAEESGKKVAIFSLASGKPVPLGVSPPLADPSADASGIAITP